MRPSMRLLGYTLAAALALSGTVRAATGDETWSRPVHAASFPLDGLPAPSTASNPHTAAITLGFVTPGNCPLQSTGVDGSIICAANPVASIAVTDPISNTGTSTAPIFGLKFTNVDVVLNGGGAIEIAAYTGAIVKAAGATATTFGLQAGQSLLGVTGSSTAAPAPVLATADNQVYQRLAGTVQAHTLDYSQLTGTPVGAVATWTGVAFFAVDGALGNDANTCMSTVSQAAAGAVSCKTIAGAIVKMPINLNGQGVRLAVNGPGSYAEPLNISGFINVGSFVVTATGTNSTAGAVAFANDANDDLYAGAVTATGMNAGGYNPTGSPTTSSFTAQLVGGGAPAFPAEPGRPLGTRMRFGSATSTAALRNFTTLVFQVTGGNQLTGSNAGTVPATPTTSDTVYLEEPGVSVSSIIIGSRNVSIVGFVAPSLRVVQAVQGSTSVAFTEINGTTQVLDGAAFQVSPLYVNNSPLAGVSVGFGLLDYGQIFVRNVQGVSITDSSSLSVGGTIGFSIQNCNGISLERFISTHGVFLAGSPSWTAPYQNIWNIGTNTSTAHGQPSRILGPATLTSGVAYAGGIILSSDVTIEQIVFSNMGAAPAIQMTGVGYRVNLAAPTGSSGNTGVGLAFPGSIVNAQGSTVSVQAGATVTGSAGDIALADGTIATWAQAAAGLSDTAGNRLIGPSTPFPIRVMPAGTTLSGGTLTVPNLAGAGGLARLDTAGKFQLDTTAYLTAPGSNGLLAWTGSAMAGRTLINSDGTINFTSPDGVAGNPEIHVNVIPESKVTNLGTDLAGKVPTTRNINTTAPMTGGGSLAGDLTLAVPVFAGSTAGLVPSSSGVSTQFLNGAGAFAVPVGTTYTGLPPIVVNSGTGQISCPTCGTSSGSVTGVFGTLGDIVVTPSSPNPTVDLAAAGPGPGTYGGSGVSSVTLDGFGRVTGVGAATYLTSTGTTPGTYNNLTVSGSGLITGASVTSWMSAGALMKSGGPAALPVPAVAGTDYQAPIGWPATPTELLISTGPSTAPTGNAGLTFASGNLILGSTVKLGGLLGNSMLYTDSGGFAATDSFGFTYDPTTHTLSPWKLAVASSATMGDLTTFGSVQFAGYAGTGGPLRVDSTGFMQVGPEAGFDSMHFYVDDFNGLTTTTWMVPGPTSGGTGLSQQSASVPPETRLSFTPTHVKLLVHNLGSPSISGCSTTFAVSKSGSAVASSELAVTNGTANNTFQDSGSVSVSASSTDSWGVILSTAPSNGSVCNFGVYVTAYFFAN